MNSLLRPVQFFKSLSEELPCSDYIKSPLRVDTFGDGSRSSTVEQSIELKDFEKLFECKELLLACDFVEELFLRVVVGYFVEFHNIHPFVLLWLYYTPFSEKVK